MRNENEYGQKNEKSSAHAAEQPDSLADGRNVDGQR